MTSRTDEASRTDDDAPTRRSSGENTRSKLSDDQRAYLRFGAMIATSMVAMFVIMYLNTYELAHVRWSETRFYMTFVMGAVMAVIMLSFMLSMHKNTKVNIGIYAAAALIFVGALFLVRSQATVEDTSYMRAMIPHHSIAILTSENATIDDVRVRELADEIIAAQIREIREMEWLIDDIDANGIAATTEDADARPIPEFSTDD